MIEKKKVTINGLNVTYRIKGEGKPLLILHGWGVSSKIWEEVMEGINNRLVICPDIPGFGESDIPNEIWDVSSYASWLKSFVKELGLEKFDVIAHSFGGRIIIKFLQNNQRMVDKLILHGSAGIRNELNLKQKLLKTGSNVSPRFIKKIFKKVLNPLLKDKDYSKANETMKEIMKKVIEEDLSVYLNNIHNKTLLIWGENDKLVPLNYAYEFNRKINNSELITIENSGHSAFKTNTEEFLRIVLNFLN